MARKKMSVTEAASKDTVAIARRTVGRLFGFLAIAALVAFLGAAVSLHIWLAVGALGVSVASMLIGVALDREPSATPTTPEKEEGDDVQAGKGSA